VVAPNNIEEKCVLVAFRTLNSEEVESTRLGPIHRFYPHGVDASDGGVNGGRFRLLTSSSKSAVPTAGRS